jgi:formate hydrogenlyase subunit 6/NADH:ubiquinone oxidoreductase subunit I
VPGSSRVRQAAQVIFFAFFVYLLFAALQRHVALPFVDIFFRFNPLSGLTAMIAAGGWIPRLGLGLVTLGLTLVLGRVWCGWICPMGTLLEWLRFPGAARRAPRLPEFLRLVKYFLLFVILTMALFGSLTLLILDPMALLTRVMTAVVLPALNHGFNAVMTALYPIGPLQGVLSGIDGVLRGAVLPVKQPVFLGSALIALLFAAIVGLNALADRFWCRYLCPLGGMLALVSKVSLFRPIIGGACTSCGVCGPACPVGAISSVGHGDRTESPSYRVIAAECIMCLDCLAACPHGAIDFAPALARRDDEPEVRRWPAPAEKGFDPSRRQLLSALGAGAAGVLVARTGARAAQPDPFLLRPPGVTDEAEFLSRCLRCTQCMKVCPTVGLQPTLFEAGLEGVWTPRLTPRLGYCNYGCNACGQVCPSQAIPALPLAEKRQQVMGQATIDHSRCLPWAEGVPCIVCEEMCPVPEKAIQLEEVTVANALGEMVTVQRPHVVSQRCIGCGICEYQCPVAGEAAIRVRRA